MYYEIELSNPSYTTFECEAMNTEEAIQKAKQYIKELKIDTYITGIMIHLNKSFQLGDYAFELDFIHQNLELHHKAIVGYLYWYDKILRKYKGAEIIYKENGYMPSYFELDADSFPKEVEGVVEDIMDNYRARFFPYVEEILKGHRDLDKKLAEIIADFKMPNTEDNLQDENILKKYLP